MKNLFRFIVILLITAAANQLHAQTGYLYGLPVIITSRTNDTASIYLRTPTKGINGIAWNVGNGKIAFQLPQDSLILSNDSVYFKNVSGYKYFRFKIGGTVIDTNALTLQKAYNKSIAAGQFSPMIDAGTGHGFYIRGLDNNHIIQSINSIDGKNFYLTVNGSNESLGLVAGTNHFLVYTDRYHTALSTGTGYVLTDVNGDGNLTMKPAPSGSGGGSGVEVTNFSKNNSDDSTVLTLSDGTRYAAVDNSSYSNAPLYFDDGFTEDGTTYDGTVTRHLHVDSTKYLTVNNFFTYIYGDTTGNAIFTVDTITTYPKCPDVSGNSYLIGADPPDSFTCITKQLNPFRNRANQVARNIGGTLTFYQPVNGQHLDVTNLTNGASYRYQANDSLWHLLITTENVNGNKLSIPNKIGNQNNKPIYFIINKKTIVTLGTDSSITAVGLRNRTGKTAHLATDTAGKFLLIADTSLQGLYPIYLDSAGRIGLAKTFIDSLAALGGTGGGAGITKLGTSPFGLIKINDSTYRVDSINVLTRLMGDNLYQPKGNYLTQANNLSDVANAATARNNILPSQTGNNTKVLQTDGTNVSWQTAAAGAPSYPQGQIVYGTGAGSYSSANNFWDTAQRHLGINTNTPAGVISAFPYFRGTVATTAASGTVTGTGTAFISSILKGDTINVNGTFVGLANAITSNTSITLDRTTLTSTISGTTYSTPFGNRGVFRVDENGRIFQFGNIVQAIYPTNKTMSIGLGAMNNPANDAVYNTSIGIDAGFSNGSRYDTYIGSEAGYSHTGLGSTFIGARAGRNTASASYVTTIGDRSLFLNVGDQNTAIGTTAGYNNYSASYCTFIGMQAGYFNTTSNYGTFVGAYSAQNVTGSSAANNTIVGFNAASFLANGSTPATSFSNYTAIGTNIRVSAATGVTNATVIGFGAIDNGSNTVTIGGPGTVATYLVGTTNTNRPIATSGSTPSYSLGAGAGTSPTASFGSGSNDAAGYVTINTGTSPTAGADVLTITFNTSLTNTPKAITLTQANGNAAIDFGKVYIDQSTASTTAFKIKNISTTALQASATYIFYYTVTQ